MVSSVSAVIEARHQATPLVPAAPSVLPFPWYGPSWSSTEKEILWYFAKGTNKVFTVRQKELKFCILGFLVSSISKFHRINWVTRSSHFDSKCYRHIRDGALTASSKFSSLTSSCCHFNHLGLFQEVEKGSDLGGKTVSSETTYPCIFK